MYGAYPYASQPYLGGDATPTTAAFWDDWTGPNGIAWDANKWSPGSGATHTIQSNRGHQLGANGVTGNHYGAKALMTAVADSETLVQVTRAAAAGAHVFARTTWTSGNATPTTGYSALLASDGQMHFWIWSGGSPTGLTSVATGFTTGTHWIRFSIVGTALKVRVWADGTTEPATWTLETTNSTHTAAGVGGLGLAASGLSGNSELTWDHLAISVPAGAPAFSGSITGATTLSGTVTGTAARAGSFSSTTTTSGTVTGNSGKFGSVTGATSTSGTLTGKVTKSGTTSGTTTFTGTITGSATRRGTLTNSTTFSGSVTGTQGNPSFTGTITGATTTSGSITGIPARQGSITGASTLSGIVDGTLVYSGAFSGTTSTSGNITGTPSYSGSLQSTITTSGSITGKLSTTGSLTNTITLTGSISGTPTSGEILVNQLNSLFLALEGELIYSNSQISIGV